MSAWHRLRRIGVVLTLFTAWTALAQSPVRYEKWFSTFGGRTAELLTLDRQGNIYVAGSGFRDLPITSNAFAPVAASSYGELQGYLLKLDPSGAVVLYCTYLNGIVPNRIAVDAEGFMYVLSNHVEAGSWGERVSIPAPITPNAAQTYPSVIEFTPVLLKIAPSGELVYGTFLGGVASAIGGLAVDPRGAATVCGYTADPNLPVSERAYQAQYQGGADAFVMRISPDGSRFEALTYLGGAGPDFCMDVKLGASGSVYIYGDTGSRFFPVTDGVYQGYAKGLENLFVAELDPNLTRLIWSTYLGSSGADYAASLALSANGSLLLTGTTLSHDFPVTPGTSPVHFKPGPNDGSWHGLIERPFFVVLDPPGVSPHLSYVFPFAGRWQGSTDQGSLFYGVVSALREAAARNSTLNAADTDGLDNPDGPGYRLLVRFDPSTEYPTYLGPLRMIGSTGVVTDAAGHAVLTGIAADEYDLSGVPSRRLGVSGAEQQPTMVLAMDFSGEKRPLVTQVVNPASLQAALVAPGQLMQIRGLGLGAPDTAKLFIDDAPVPVLSAEQDTILAVAPVSIADKSSFKLSVQRDGVLSDERTVPVVAVNPALYTTPNIGAGQALAINADGAPNSPQEPARKGQRLRLFATGLGLVERSDQPLAAIAANVSGVPASVIAAAASTAYGEGYFAIDIVVPQGTPSGDFIPVEIRVGDKTSQWGVTVALR